MAKFKNGNLVISDGKKISIGSTDITENSFTEVLSDAESYANSGDSDTLSTADVNLRSRAGNNRIVTSDSTAESGEILLVDASLGNVTIYITPENNARITVKKIDSSANQVRMASADGFVENFETIALKNQYEYINILCDGENWWGVASNVTVRADLSYSSSSSSSSSSNSSSSSSKSYSSSSSSSSFSSTIPDSLPVGLSGFPIAPDYLQVVMGNAWSGASPWAEDTVINLYKIYGESTWTEDGTLVASGTNRLKLNIVPSTNTDIIQLFGCTDGVTFQTAVSFTAVVGTVYVLGEVLNGTRSVAMGTPFVTTPGTFAYKNGIFKSITYITYNPNNFKFQVYYSAGGTFTLPIADGGAGYNHNFTVSWGDGTPDSTITSYDDADATHTYAGSGTYDVHMFGTCEYFAFNAGGDGTKLTELIEFNGDMGFKVLNFNGCSSLTTIVPLGTMAALTTAERMFYNCNNVGFTTIPADLFAGCPNITTFKETFYSCQKITAIPSGLFDNNTLATNFTQTFRRFGTSGYGIAVPADLFKYNTIVTTFKQTFNQASSFTSIPADLFKYNILVTDFSSTFSSTRIASIPTDLFRYNTLVTTFSSTFSSNTYLTGAIPVDIFLYNDSVTTVQSCFSGCTNMTGSGQDVIDNFVPAPGTTTGCFLNCTSLTDYASLPAGWK